MVILRLDYSRALVAKALFMNSRYLMIFLLASALSSALALENVRRMSSNYALYNDKPNN